MNIRSHTTLVGVFPLISCAGTAGLSPLGLCRTEFAGRFTLPFKARWGQMVLPAGSYNLYYGTLAGDMCYVEILGIDQNGSRGIFIIREQGPASVVQNALVCVNTSGGHVVRTLELPAIGKSVSFVGAKASKPLERRSAIVEMHLAGAPV